MTIDINRLTEAELGDLHNRIVARLKLMQQMRAHADMLDFRFSNDLFYPQNAFAVSIA